MLKKILNRLMHHSQPSPAVQPEPRNKLGSGFYWEYDSVPNGYGGYKTVNVWLLKMDDPHFRRCIVDSAGNIQHFPGFMDRAWASRLEIPMADQQVKFVFHIHSYQNGRANVRWLIQPDGRYFADEDGFGAEHMDAIEVYSCLDEEGNFTEPFHMN